MNISDGVVLSVLAGALVEVPRRVLSTCGGDLPTMDARSFSPPSAIRVENTEIVTVCGKITNSW